MALHALCWPTLQLSGHMPGCCKGFPLITRMAAQAAAKVGAWLRRKR
jgi:hypothetical protein